jgi:2'-5' RNA ligase
MKVADSCVFQKIWTDRYRNPLKRQKQKLVMRTFVAVEITNRGVLDSIKKLQDGLEITAKPVEMQNMHFTLMFLGEITEEMAQKVLAQLRTIEFASFDIGFEGIGAFPKPKFPRVVWVGIEKDGATRLVALAKSVEERLEGLGFHSDKPFKPHMTIFRVKNRVGDITYELSKHTNEKFGVQKINEIKFKKSVLTPSGPIYSDIGVITSK